MQIIMPHNYKKPIENENPLHLQNKNPKEYLKSGQKFTFLQYEIGGWGALIALIVSLLTGGWTLYERFLSSPSPTLTGPAAINFLCYGWDVDEKKDEYFCPGEETLDGYFIVRAGPLVFLNDTYAKNSFLATESYVDVNFLKGDKTEKYIRLKWKYFSDATPSGTRHNSVSPVKVTNSDPQSREIEYHPRHRRDESGVVTFSDKYPFEAFKKDVAEKKYDAIRLTFYFKTSAEESPLEAHCTIGLDSDIVRLASNKETVLYSRDCK